MVIIYMNTRIIVSLGIALFLIAGAIYGVGVQNALGQSAICGNDIVESGEACDGSADCTSGCTLRTPAPACGNDIVEDGEQCDGSANCTTGCKLAASAPACGNDIIEAGEECDGSANCTTGCKLQTTNGGGGGGGGFINLP